MNMPIETRRDESSRDGKTLAIHAAKISEVLIIFFGLQVRYEEDQMGCREAVHKVRMIIKVYLVETKSLT